MRAAMEERRELIEFEKATAPPPPPAPPVPNIAHLLAARHSEELRHRAEAPAPAPAPAPPPGTDWRVLGEVVADLVSSVESELRREFDAKLGRLFADVVQLRAEVGVQAELNRLHDEIAALRGDRSKTLRAVS